MEWVLAPKAQSNINDLFTDLINQRVQQSLKGDYTKQFSGDMLTALSAQNNEKKAALSLENLKSKYGTERLERMSDREFYELFKTQVSIDK